MPQAEILFWLVLAATLAGVAVWYLRGWWIRRTSRQLRRDFYQGLSELLQDETDRALDIFLGLAHQHEEMVELQLMLASLFRQRGEVDRSIRIHQNLLDRSKLPQHLKREVIAGLGQDFMKAGVYDRAEQYFLSLETVGELPPLALKSLVKIYEMERDWRKAIRYALQLERQRGTRMSDVVAYYYCELAEQALKQKNWKEAQERITQALAKCPGSARARIMEARLHMRREEPGRAMTSWKLAMETRPDLMCEVWDEIRACYQMLHPGEPLSSELESLLDKVPAAQAQLIRAEILKQEQGSGWAERILRRQLSKTPTISGVECWLELLQDLRQDDELVATMSGIVHELKLDKRPWQCDQCGFTASHFQWQCPGCKSWGSIRFIHGRSGE